MSLFGPKIVEKLPYLAKKPHFRAIFYVLGWVGMGLGWGWTWLDGVERGWMGVDGVGRCWTWLDVVGQG